MPIHLPHFKPKPVNTMRLLFVLFFILLYFQPLLCQFNMERLDQIDYSAEANDVWGYTAPDGTEYALVGLTSGVSIVSLKDPSNIEEVAFVPGDFSIWRDLKTWGHFAYVTADQRGSKDGLLIIDLSKLPQSVTYENWTPKLANFQDSLFTCHNLYIDEQGVCYLAGCNVNSGGMILLDVDATPGSPALLGIAPSEYSHDVYTRNNRMYSSEIFNGQLAIYDVSNKANPSLLATQKTPYTFTHNTWLSDNGKTIFTTDEKSNAPIAAYDISNPSDIKLLDQFRPLKTIGQGVIPHNVHVRDDYLLISYYTDGGVIVDAARPGNLVEVASYDTYPNSFVGFDGAWGLYPFLPSGLVLVSDITYGLFVLKPTLKRACYLEGKITEAGTGNSIQGATIKILSDQENATSSGIDGLYATGQAQAGSFQVLVEKLGYIGQTLSVQLINGELTELNVALQKAATYNLVGKVISESGNLPVKNAKVQLFAEAIQYNTVTDDNGNFDLTAVLSGNYNIYAGAWGYLHKKIELVPVNANGALTIILKPGYQDDFFADFGWTTDQEASTTGGLWTWVKPVGTVFFEEQANPAEDLATDVGDRCYLTGNRGGDASVDDVDNGKVELKSPAMDLSDYKNPLLSFYAWFFNGGGSGTPDDTLFVKLTNGVKEVVVLKISEPHAGWQLFDNIPIKNFLPLEDNMRVIFETGDLSTSGHIVEAAVDGFIITDGTPTPVANVVDPSKVEIKIGPNPSQSHFLITITAKKVVNSGVIVVTDALGRILEQNNFSAAAGSSYNFQLGENFAPGVYYVTTKFADESFQTSRVLKF